MKWYEWIFDGVGTAIISVICGFISYKTAINKVSKQIQVAGNNSKQIQKTSIKQGDNNIIDNVTIKQIQKAGNNSEQIQIGDKQNEE